MAAASIESTLELWASSLRDVKARMRPLFTQERVAVSAGLFLDGLLGTERRKTGWMRASIYGLGREDHELPDRRLYRVCLAPRACLYRPGALSAQELDRR